MLSSAPVTIANQKTIPPSPLSQALCSGNGLTINFLLDCVKAHFGTLAPEKFQSIDTQTLDWRYLLLTARRHGMVPILYKSLQRFCPNTVPPTILAHLKQRSGVTARRNLALTVELLNLLQWLDSHNIPAVPFKGPVLATSAYGDLSLRQFVDLDILIHKKDAPKIKQLMLADGYEQVSHVAANDAYEALYLEAACEYNFFRPDRRVAVEPHWDFAPTKLCLSLNPEALWHRLEQLSVAGKPLPTFSAEDTLLIVCINGMKDYWDNFKTICDVAALVINCSINWDVLLERARRTGCQRILWLGLNLAHALVDVPIPAPVLQRIQADNMTQQLTTQVSQRLFDDTVEQPDDDHFGGNFSIWNLQLRERKRDKIRYLLNLIFKPNEGEALMLALPKTLYWVYPFLRPVRLVMRLGRNWLR